ncbi:hypothetical protein LX36DRAFT_249318 [Colletotrichum falcatum]|nr:hypothetical protein LX36DRAFT_249318 [Colletotrichum falcatum]
MRRLNQVVGLALSSSLSSHLSQVSSKADKDGSGPHPARCLGTYEYLGRQKRGGWSTRLSRRHILTSKRSSIPRFIPSPATLSGPCLPRVIRYAFDQMYGNTRYYSNVHIGGYLPTYYDVRIRTHTSSSLYGLPGLRRPQPPEKFVSRCPPFDDWGRWNEEDPEIR